MLLQSTVEYFLHRKWDHGCERPRPTSGAKRVSSWQKQNQAAFRDIILQSVEAAGINPKLLFVCKLFFLVPKKFLFYLIENIT